MKQVHIIEYYGEIRTDGTCHMTSDSIWVDIQPTDWQDEKYSDFPLDSEAPDA